MYSCWISCCLLLLPPLALGKNLRVFIMAGQSNMEGYARVGSLRELVDNPVSNHPWDDFSHLVNADGSWKVRSDVSIAFRGKISKLSVGKGSDGAKFGPELGFGDVVGDYFTEPVLIIKYAVGGTSLAVDWRPDSSGIPVDPLRCMKGPCTALEYGKVYREMLAFVETVLQNLATMAPEYAGFKPILSGFVWFHGFNDSLVEKFRDEYRRNLANLIRDVRMRISPNLKVIIGELGMFGPYTNDGAHLKIRAAQRSVAEDPAFASFTTFVKTAQYVYPNRPRFDGDYHYYGRPDTIYQIGHQFGRAAILELFPTPTTGFPTFAPSNMPSTRPSSNRPSVSPTNVNPSRVPSVSPSAFPTPTDGYCGDNMTSSFYVPQLDECHSCLWLAARPNYQRELCNSVGPFSASVLCEETCGKCQKALCDDDREALFFSSHAGDYQHCSWLAGRPWYIPIYCNPGHLSGAFYLCEETCGRCSDACKDTDGYFVVDGIYRPCSWLVVRPDVQDVVCSLSGTGAAQLCPETCNTCDGLPAGTAAFGSAFKEFNSENIGGRCQGAPSAMPSNLPSSLPSALNASLTPSIPSKSVNAPKLL